MLDKVRPAGSDTAFAHVKPFDTIYRGDGLRDFFLYRDLGVAAATNGKVLAQLVIAHNAPEKGTGWHRHEADFHIVIMLRGWARFMYEDQETLVSAGDCVHQRPGVRDPGAPGLGCLTLQNSISSSSMASGSFFAAAIHSCISGRARMASQ
jgi:mannose-6-phosphate isomerase-like protein (cupin superfamily)